MKKATVIYISSETDVNGFYYGFNLMADEGDYHDKYIKWPLSLNERIEYHDIEDIAVTDNVHLIPIGTIHTANFHNFTWGKDVTDKRFGDRLRAWRKDSVEYPVELLVPEENYYSSELDDGTIRGIRLNYFHEALEYDVTYNSSGTLIWGDGTQANTYYINAFGISSESSPYDWSGYSLNRVNFYCPVPWWKKITSVYSSGSEDESGGSEEPTYIKDYENNYDFDPYDYIGSRSAIINVDNTNGLGSKYIAYVKGPAELPKIEITDVNRTSKIVLYFRDLNLVDGDVLVVDSIDKTCLVYHSDGSIDNVFQFRDTTEGYLWNRILAGKNIIKSSSGFEYRIDLVEERSEPKWPMV